MKTVKRILEVLTVVVLAAVITLGIFSAGAASDDPADNYVKQTAPYEDASLKLWFDYSFRKNLTSDTTSTGMDTFSIYMAKNEIESAQFLLCSDTDKINLLAEVTDFTDGKGNTIPADIYYEMYTTVTDLNKDAVYGTNKIIREGEVPDPVMNIERIAMGKKPAYFKLNGGKSQAFLIRAKSAEDTPAGWYSAQLNIKNESGEIIKTATVYCHVWDFVISEKTEFRTAFFLSDSFPYGGSYKEAYDYLLENRLCAMDIPLSDSGYTAPSSDNPYLTNPRVNSVRVTANGGGYNNHYSDLTGLAAYPGIYDDLSSSPSWNEIKDKLYFYSVDEPLPYVMVGSTRQNVDDVKSFYSSTQYYWPEDIKFLVTTCEDSPYSPRDTYYTKPIDQYSQEQIKDAYQEIIEKNSVQIFCAKVYELTPYSELLTWGNTAFNEFYYTDCVRSSLNNVFSGCYGVPGNAPGGVFDWINMYGDTFDRFQSHIINENAKNNSNNYDLWMYSANENSTYTYTNHIIENTGLQTKLLFWQAYQNDVNGYLYYATNGWQEQSPIYLDTTVTGSKTGSWPVNRVRRSIVDVKTGVAHDVYHYGNGVMFYGKQNAKTTSDGIVGSLRVELLRDSVEEYQMLSMLGDLKGKDRAKEIVSEVSTNVVRYLSLSGFDRSAWDGSMDDYDIMETVRRGLGDELEAAVKAGECNHAWDTGTVTKAATCKEMGTTLYTCTKCDAERTEYIPTLHEVGDCFRVVSEVATTCTTDGSKVLECTVCGFRKTLVEMCYHNDNINHRVYASKDETGHSEACDVCGKILTTKTPHMFFNIRTEATCTEPGGTRRMCKNCGFVLEEISSTPATGHNFSDGYCTVCGEKDPDYKTYTPGDLNGDSKINASDMAILKKVIVGKSPKTDAADVDSDGKVTGSDAVLLKKKIVGKA